MGSGAPIPDKINRSRVWRNQCRQQKYHNYGVANRGRGINVCRDSRGHGDRCRTGSRYFELCLFNVIGVPGCSCNRFVVYRFQDRIPAIQTMSTNFLVVRNIDTSWLVVSMSMHLTSQFIQPAAPVTLQIGVRLHKKEIGECVKH